MNTSEQNPDTVERPAEEGDFSRDPGIEDTPDPQRPHDPDTEVSPDDPDIAGEDASGQPS
ncbi:hypothetical protein [Pseudomonas kuykendallii]|uniref:hypothetical protein n=1 Tax=Pseudomonas kuykendallii TaxID=1007099 RepID=UPI0028D1BF58|nr:hypothetical protein [Pseudomonas kuykendallii]